MKISRLHSLFLSMIIASNLITAMENPKNTITLESLYNSAQNYVSNARNYVASFLQDKRTQKGLAAFIALYAGWQGMSKFSKQQTAMPQQNLPIADITYNCNKKRLKLTLQNTGNTKKYFPNIDTYEYSPTKKYLLLNTITTTNFKQAALAGNLPKKEVTTQLVSSSTGLVHATFVNSAMHEFNADDTKLVVLAPNQTFFSGLFGKKTEHSDTTGKLQKSNTLMEYTVFDIANKTTLKTIKNASSVTFISLTQVAVIYEDKTRETINLEQSYFNLFGTQASQPVLTNLNNIEYFPSIKTLKITDNDGIKHTFEAITGYSFSPAKKYLIIQKLIPLSLLNRALGGTHQLISGTKNATYIIDMESGTIVKDINLNDINLDNVISYEFSPKETMLLLRLRNEKCSYICYDIVQLDMYQKHDIVQLDMEQKIITNKKNISGQSVQFKSETKFTIIDENGKKDILINPQKESPLMPYIETIGKKIQGYTETASKLFSRKPAPTENELNK